MFQKFSQKLIIVLAALWVILLAVPMELYYRYYYIGALILCLGFHNMILLTMGQRTGNMPEKIKRLQQRHGEEKAILLYSLGFILAFLLLGLSILYGSYQLQFPRT